MLQAAREAIKAAKKADREARRDAAELKWGKMTMKDWADDYRTAITAAIACQT